MADRRIMSQINVTPLVDVMLVLLVIFMITAPMMESGIDVNLPKVEAGPLGAAEEEPLILTIKADGKIFINDKAIQESQLREKLASILRRRQEKAVFLKADSSVPYGQVAKVMSDVKNAGGQKLGMVTEPVTEKEK